MQPMKKLFIMSLVLMMLISSVLNVSAMNIVELKLSNEEMKIIREQERELLKFDAKIDELYEQRILITSKEKVNINELNEIDLQLEALGVEFLNIEDIAIQFPETKNLGYKESLDEKNAGTKVSVPSSSVNTWTSIRYSNQYYGGERYNIQKLTAIPKSKASGLWHEKTKTINYNYNWEAGKTSLLKTTTSTIIGGVYKNASIVLTVFDALKDALSNIRKESIIDPTDVIYSWDTKTTALFFYVRPEAYGDSSQRLSEISTKCYTSLGYIVDATRWDYDGNGTYQPFPNNIGGDREWTDTPDYYNSRTRAIQAYRAGHQTNHDVVRYIKLSGAESKTIQYIYPLQPQFPLECEY